MSRSSLNATSKNETLNAIKSCIPQVFFFSVLLELVFVFCNW
uniref:Uncharacterized protein n=1 Tax=Rhizophora mucronata TaxID=61149 RepID=A0A2P2NPV1_RHIMU